MKKYFYLSLVFIGLGFTQSSNAQISVNVNIGSQPSWGPVGYDYARYYYLPEMDVYYDVNNRRYTYYHGNRWVTNSRLPGRYGHFDIYRTYKVVINESSPWHHHSHHRSNYRRHAHNHSQIIIRDGGRGHNHGRYDRDDRHHKQNKYNKKSHKRHDEKSRGNGRRNHDD